MEFLNDYIVLGVVAVCLAVGYIIKHLIPSDKINRFIPLIMGAMGVGINVWLTGALNPEVLIGGLISGLASTGMHELFTQFISN